MPGRGDTARRNFERLASLPDEQVDVAEGALWIAADGRPGLDVPAALARLEALAFGARGRVDVHGSAGHAAGALLDYLVRDERFHGNEDDYYDPANSYLDVVLDRRSGIPITLSLVFIAVARRLGLLAHGICFPGHFLAKAVGGDGDESVVDVFYGEVLSRAACEQRLREALGPDARLTPQALRAATTREILTRMLANLKQVHLRRREFERALSCCDRLLWLDPLAAQELRDRGLLLHHLACSGPAADDLERYLELVPDDPQAEALADLARRARLKAPPIH